MYRTVPGNSLPGSAPIRPHGLIHQSPEPVSRCWEASLANMRDRAVEAIAVISLLTSMPKQARKTDTCIVALAIRRRLVG